MTTGRHECMSPATVPRMASAATAPMATLSAAPTTPRRNPWAPRRRCRSCRLCARSWRRMWGLQGDPTTAAPSSSSTSCSRRCAPWLGLFPSSSRPRCSQKCWLLLTRHARLSLSHTLPPTYPCLQIQIASIFLVGCPACNHNFKHFFCLLTCSPDQASFSNITAAQTAADTNATAVAGIDYFVSGNVAGARRGKRA
jgi:hypothetical protein